MSYIKDAGRDTFLSNYIGILDALYGTLISRPDIVLVALLPGKSYWAINFQSKYMTILNENKNIYHGSIKYKKKVLWFIPITITVTNKDINQPAGVLPYDIYSGGQQRTNPNQLPLANIVSNIFGFIPTASALDIGKGTTVLDDTDYRKSYVGALPPMLPKNSPFQNFTTHFDIYNPSNNSLHISFNTRNGNWLRSELNTSIADDYTNCSFICASNKIIGAETICTAENYSLPTGATTYNWIISEGADLVTLTGNGTPNITLTSSNNGNGYITMQATISDVRCGTKTLLKKVYIGLPTFTNFTYKCAPSLCFTDISADNYAFSTPVQLQTKNQLTAIFAGLTPLELLDNNNWQWQEQPQPGEPNLLFLSGSKNKRSICALGDGTTILQVRVHNVCGWSEWEDFPITIIQLPPSFLNRQIQPSNTITLKADTSDTSGNTNSVTQYSWANENIWIRNSQDGIIDHQNPKYSDNVPNYIYVKITNNGCGTTTSGLNLKTYWAKASTSLDWPASWSGATYNDTDTQLGNQ